MKSREACLACQSLLLLPINKNVYVSQSQCWNVLCVYEVSLKEEKKKSFPVKSLSTLGWDVPGSQHLSTSWSALRSERGGWCLSRHGGRGGSELHSAVSEPSPTSYFPQCNSQSARDEGQGILHYKQSLSVGACNIYNDKQDTAGKSAIWQGVPSATLGAAEIGTEHTGTQLLTNSNIPCTHRLNTISMEIHTWPALSHLTLTAKVRVTHGWAHCSFHFIGEETELEKVNDEPKVIQQKLNRVTRII